MRSRPAHVLRLTAAALLLAGVLSSPPVRADEHADNMLNILKKRPRGSTPESWLEERREAARELGRLKDKRAVPVLLGIVAKERFDVILEIAIDALGEIGDRRAVGPLKKLLNDPSLDAYVRDAVAGALKKLGEEVGELPILVNQKNALGQIHPLATTNWPVSRTPDGVMVSRPRLA